MPIAFIRAIRVLVAAMIVAATCVVAATPGRAQPVGAVSAPRVVADDETDVAAEEGSKERIAFVSFRDMPDHAGGPFLHTMDVDGSDVRRVNTSFVGRLAHRDPVWSPDGVYLAYEVYSVQGEPWPWGIRRVAASGGEDVVLVPPTPDYPWPTSPAWSPDGDRLAFSANGSIWLMDLRTSELDQLAEGGSPTWSPDGSRLAVGRTGAIWLVNADGTDPTQLTFPPETFGDGHPDWSPDGTQIVFHRKDGREANVLVVDVDGSNERQLTTQTGSEPVWSPDGSRIAFASGRDSGDPGSIDESDIYVMDADGSNVVRLTTRGGSAPAWRRVPDPVTDVDLVVLGGSGVFDWRTRRWIPGAVSEAVATELDLMTTGSLTRLAGSDRYGTAVAISEAYFPPGVPVVYVATGENYPDALTAGAAAGHQGGPVLLVAANSIPSVVSRELERLAPQRIVVVGGTGVVSEAVATQLAAYTAGAVTRLGGLDRYGTAAAVSNDVFSPGVDVAYIATGGNFPDALPAAAAAGTLGGPLLLVQQHTIPSATATELTRLAPKRIVIAGEADVVSDAVAAGLGAYTTGSVERQAGSDRFATAAAISRAVRPGGASTVFIATGADYPDGVAASPAAIMADAPLLLVWTDFLPTTTRRELIRLGSVP